jgi:hypothetical protein
MIKKVGLLSIFITIILLSSCEKELVINLPEGKKQLVVEGYIETDSLPYVILTKSIGFFDKIDISSIQFARDAEITVRDLNTNFTKKLQRFEFPFGTDTFTIYGLVPFDPSNDSIKGVAGHKYELIIQNEGKQHKAITTIPFSVLPDSTWLRSLGAATDSVYEFNCRYTDPDTPGNFTRYKTQVKRANKKSYLSEAYLTSFSSTFDDKFTNGATLPFNVDMGYDKNINFNDSASQSQFREQRSIFKGDTVTVKFSGIDYYTYQFWQTLEYSRNSTGNPFASPTKVSSNVSGAIGIWGGYGSKYLSIIAPK